MFFKQFHKQSLAIHICHQWSQDETHDTTGMLIYVENGLGALQESYDTKKSSGYATLLLHGVPLLQVYGDEYFCPTCEKMIRSGYQLSQDEIFSLDGLNASKQDVCFADAVKSIHPILGLLSTGYYILHDTQLYPTDGNGHLFWNYPNENITRPGSCPFYFGNGMYAYGTPTFTIATQSRTLCQEERVAYYQTHNDARAIAYYVEGFLCALLDGHHKMLAAARNQSMCNALVIERCTICKVQTNYFLNSTIYNERNKKAFQISQKQYDMIQSMLEHRTSHQDIAHILSYYEEPRDQSELISITKEQMEAYPGIVQAAARSRLGTDFDRYVQDVIHHKHILEDDTLFIFIQALQSLQDKALCQRICSQLLSDSYSKDIQFELCKVLVKLPRNEELQQQLIDLYIAYEDCSYICNLIGHAL